MDRDLEVWFAEANIFVYQKPTMSGIGAKSLRDRPTQCWIFSDDLTGWPVPDRYVQLL